MEFYIIFFFILLDFNMWSLFEDQAMKVVLIKNVVQIVNVIHGPTLDKLSYFHF
jgi:hypothetical protein